MSQADPFFFDLYCSTDMLLGECFGFFFYALCSTEREHLKMSILSIYLMVICLQSPFIDSEMKLITIVCLRVHAKFKDS